MGEMPKSERPISEQYRLVAKKWVEADAAARILDEMKTTVLEQKKTAFMQTHGDMSDAKAERIIKSQPDWAEYIREMCDAKTSANLLRQQLAYLEMRHREFLMADARARAEMQL